MAPAPLYLLDILEFGGESPLTMRAWCRAFHYFPNPLGFVPTEQLDKLDFVLQHRRDTAPAVSALKYKRLLRTPGDGCPYKSRFFAVIASLRQQAWQSQGTAGVFERSPRRFAPRDDFAFYVKLFDKLEFGELINENSMLLHKPHTPNYRKSG